MKRIIYVLSLLVTAAAMHAENSFSVAPVEIQPGEEKTISVILTNDEDAKTAAIDITLPTGLSFVNGGTDGSVVFSERTSGMPSKSAKIQTSGALRIGMAFGVVSAGSGELFTFKVKAAVDATPGSSKIKYSAMALTLSTSGKTVLSDMESDVTIYKTCKVDIQTANYAGGSVALNKGTIGDNVMYGTDFEVLATANEGYHFAKWSNDITDNPYSFTVSSDTTLKAVFVPDQYTISYDLAGGALSAGVTNPDSYTIESESFTLNNPFRDNYTFTGWTGTGLSSASTNVTIAKGSTGNRSYTATWTETLYTMTFVLDNGEDDIVMQYAYTAAITIPEDPTRTGFTFKGWSPEIPATAPAENKTFTAQWERNSYLLKFIVDGETVKEENVLYEDPINVPEDPEKDDFVFVGWEPEVATYMPAENVTYTAVFSPIIIDQEDDEFIVSGDDTAELKEVANDINSDGIISIPATVDNGGTTLQVTSISDDAFENVEKDKITVIDLSATGITNVNVDRSSGVFKGFPESTLIYMPAGNTIATGEKNVVIGGICAELALSEDMTFKALIAFDVNHVIFDRDFESGKAATVYLPFSIPSEEAAKLGNFHTFKQISDEGTAVFNAALTGDIEANVPYIFIPKATVTAIDVTSSSTDIHVPIAPSIVGTNGNLIGTTTSIVWDEDNVPVNIYGFAGEERKNISVGTFVKAAIGASIAPYRAYLVINDVAAAPQYKAILDDQASGIISMKDSMDTDDKWYNLKGQRIEGNASLKGVFIKNGKKIVIK